MEYFVLSILIFFVIFFIRLLFFDEAVTGPEPRRVQGNALHRAGCRVKRR